MADAPKPAARTAARKPPAEGAAAAPAADRKAGANAAILGSIPVEISAPPDRPRLQVRHVLELEVGRLVRLQARPGDLLELWAPGVRLARGEVRVRDGKRWLLLTAAEGAEAPHEA